MEEGAGQGTKRDRDWHTCRRRHCGVKYHAASGSRLHRFSPDHPPIGAGDHEEADECGRRAAGTQQKHIVRPALSERGLRRARRDDRGVGRWELAFGLRPLSLDQGDTAMACSSGAPRCYSVGYWSRLTGGRACTSSFVMLSWMPSSTPVTALIGMATSLRPHRCPSSRSTCVTW
jgi:hypothetical protein